MVSQTSADPMVRYFLETFSGYFKAAYMRYALVMSAHVPRFHIFSFPSRLINFFGCQGIEEGRCVPILLSAALVAFHQEVRGHVRGACAQKSTTCKLPHKTQARIIKATLNATQHHLWGTSDSSLRNSNPSPKSLSQFP